MIPAVTAVMSLAQYVPTILRWIGGPKQADAADKILAIARSVTGSDDPVAALQADPNKVLEFQKAVYLGSADLDKAYLSDRQDARRMAVESGMAAFTVKLGAAIIFTCLLIEGLVLTLGLPKAAAPETVGRVLGTIDAIAMAVVFYIYGSSRGSAAKDDAARAEKLS